MNPHEEAFVRAFVAPARQERFLTFVSNPKKRQKFIDELCHVKPGFLAEKYVRPIVGAEDLPSALFKSLRAMGAPERCWVIGGRLDGREVELMEAIREAAGRDGVLLSCIPGRLAYLAGEDDSFLCCR